MRSLAVMLTLLMITTVQFGIIERAEWLEEGEVLVPSSGSDCSNQTHSGSQFHVDQTSGNDSWAGTQQCPKMTIQSAVSSAAQGETIVVGAGTYHEVVTLDKGEVTLKAAEGERVILDGSESVTGDLGGTWTVHDSSSPEGVVWKANLSKEAWQLFVDYEEEMPAR